LDALTLHRIHFGFTITYHYLFPQLTMGLALLIIILRTIALRAIGPERQAKYDIAARFWGKIFAINFLLGVVTGVPM
jgi:cytochrome bd ubiquinol oxidase subunit I